MNAQELLGVTTHALKRHCVHDSKEYMKNTYNLSKWFSLVPTATPDVTFFLLRMDSNSVLHKQLQLGLTTQK